MFQSAEFFWWHVPTNIAAPSSQPKRTSDPRGETVDRVFQCGCQAELLQCFLYERKKTNDNSRIMDVRLFDRPGPWMPESEDGEPANHRADSDDAAQDTKRQALRARVQGSVFSVQKIGTLQCQRQFQPRVRSVDSAVDRIGKFHDLCT